MGLKEFVDRRSVSINSITKDTSFLTYKDKYLENKSMLEVDAAKTCYNFIAKGQGYK